jgi:hypothetical protein
LTSSTDGNDDDRLPLRWGVILLGALGTGAVVGFLGGPLAGFGAGLAITALLYKILGH